ncbi:POK10 protein, partial [Machaerirhynchus nigripectus]|nr:POK10 protein [Machaerirhynchus nigripectus]
AQKLLGTINWLGPYLGLTTAQLSPLFDTLKGDPDLNLQQTLTPEARRSLDEVQHAVSTHQVYRVDLSIDIAISVVIPDLHPTGITGQWSQQWPNPLHAL